MKKFFLFFYFLISFNFYMVYSEQDIENNFVEYISIENKKITLDKLVKVKASLKFPENYKPNKDKMGQNLVSYAGLLPPPFILKSIISGPIKTTEGFSNQIIEFIISPQRTGNHFLTFEQIYFISDNLKESVWIPSDIIAIEVSPIIQDFYFNQVVSLPMKISEEIPLQLSQENKELFVDNFLLQNKNKIALVNTLKERSFPWTHSLSFIVVLIVILYLWKQPAIEQSLQDIIRNNQAIQALAIKNLKGLLENPIDGDFSLFFLKLESALMAYLDTLYDLKSDTLTTEELSKKIRYLTLGNQLILIFQKAENIKFVVRF